MSVALQIREVPEEVRGALANAAAARGQSLQAYLLDTVTKHARQLRNVQTLERLEGHRVDLQGDLDPVALIRQDRDNGFQAERSIDPVL
ncbi:MAG: hypothetical protein LBO75_03910 [Bifidobacteriaceae bacterium]|jgi:hypothetical protein|nr:hypothetical protein [Bifidobacteriaceae bacterium]